MTVDTQKFPKSAIDLVNKLRQDQTLDEEIREYYQRLYEKYNLEEVLRERNS